MSRRSRWARPLRLGLEGRTIQRLAVSAPRTVKAEPQGVTWKTLTWRPGADRQMQNLLQGSTVFVIDDDPSACDSVVAMIRLAGGSAKSFAMCEDFLQGRYQTQPGCVVADLRMPGMSGLSLLEEMRKEGSRMPLILVTAYADVPLAVDALKYGALTVIEKPYRQQCLWDWIMLALKTDQERRAADHLRFNILDRLKSLTEEETAVLEMMASDVPNKIIAARLQMSARTVDHRRQDILSKLQMESVKALIWHLGAAGYSISPLSSSRR